MTGSPIRCVVFDLDDTLYLERDYVRSGFFAVGRYLEERHDLQGFESAAWQEFEAGRRGDIFDHDSMKTGWEFNLSCSQDLGAVFLKDNFVDDGCDGNGIHRSRLFPPTSSFFDEMVMT